MTTHISLWYSIPPNKAPLKALFFSRFFEKDNEIKRRRIERECNQISASDRQMHYDLSKWKNDKWFWTTTTKIKSDFIGLPFTDHFKYPRKKKQKSSTYSSSFTSRNNRFSFFLIFFVKSKHLFAGSHRWSTKITGKLLLIFVH